MLVLFLSCLGLFLCCFIFLLVRDFVCWFCLAICVFDLLLFSFFVLVFFMLILFCLIV